MAVVGVSYILSEKLEKKLRAVNLERESESGNLAGVLQFRETEGQNSVQRKLKGCVNVKFQSSSKKKPLQLKRQRARLQLLKKYRKKRQ